MNDHSKKKIAPIVITVLFVGYLLVYIVFLFFATSFHPAIALLALPLLALAAGMVYILYTRIKEIDGGEEDDLSNY